MSSLVFVTNLALTLVAVCIFMLSPLANCTNVTVCHDGCDFDDLGSAVDAAMPGETLDVMSGTYHGPINITKPLTLIGIDTGEGMPIIEGLGAGSVVTITADGVTLSGLIVKGSKKSEPGLRISSVGNTVTYCEIGYNDGDGILLDQFGKNVIAFNTISFNGGDGIRVANSNNNQLKTNYLGYNDESGINVESSSSNTIRENVVNHNHNGVTLDHASRNQIGSNSISDSEVDGISLMKSSTTRIEFNDLFYNYNGIRLLTSSDNRILSNNASFNDQDGVRLIDSAGNVLYSNVLADNEDHDAYDDGNSNMWYVQDMLCGNFYTDYVDGCADLDSNDMCDLPYAIPGGSAQDLYPVTSSSVLCNGSIFDDEVNIGYGSILGSDVTTYDDSVATDDNSVIVNDNSVIVNDNSIIANSNDVNTDDEVLFSTDEYKSFTGPFGNDTYPFLEFWTSAVGTSVEGNYPRMMIDFPFYHLSGSSLTSVRQLELSDKTIALFGVGRSLSGDLGGGASSSLVPVDDLPFAGGDIVITSIDGDVFSFDYLGEEITLTAGDERVVQTEELRSANNATMLVNTTITIKNHGLVHLQMPDGEGI